MSRSGPLQLAGASLLFGGMAFVAKLAGAGLPGEEVAFVRFAFCCVALALLVGSRRVRLVPRNLRALALRGLFGGLAVLLFFRAIEHLPVGMATLLNYTYPIWSALFAALFLGERLDVRIVGALTATTLGVVLVVRGAAPPGDWGFGPWHVVGMVSSLLSGAAVTTIRAMRRSAVPDGAWEIFAGFSLVGLICTAPFAAGRWQTPTPRQWLLLAVMGALSFAAQLLMTHALGFVRAAAGGAVAQLTPVVSFALGALFLGEPVGAQTLLGAGLTLAGVLWAGRTSAAAG
jgi:drug/metabolite transporter (DMT)-like permease